MLGFKCSQKNNKMDVFFMNEELIFNTIQKDSWEQIYVINQKIKKFFVNDLDRNAIFMITI